MWPVIAVIVLGLVAAASGPPPERPSVQRTVGPLVLELTLDKATYLAGEPVEARVVLRNTGAAPVTVHFPSGQRFDLVVRRRGALVWRWSHDKAFIQVVQDVTLDAGRALAFSASWPQVDLQGRRVEPGTYEAVGVLTGRLPDGPGREVETPALPFQIRG